MNELTIHLALDKKETVPGQLPEATLVLSNEGSSELLVNARMLLVPGETPERIGEVVFRIAGPPGSISLKTFQVNAGAARREDFARLRPGESVVRSYPLEKYFRYTNPGSYRVTATYRNMLRVNDGELTAWTGSLTSNEQHFDIKA
ncbi:MAG TPA: hypothetical protein VGB46_01235 [Flavisolibacter sp.]|jgi:hypothetical protein